MSRKDLILLVSLFLLSFLFVTACDNQAKAQEYVNQADKYRSSGKLDDAISLYKKALNIKEDTSVRDKLDDTKKEKETVKQVTEVLKDFKEVKEYYLQDNSDYSSPTTIKEAVDKLRPAVDKIEAIDDTQDTDISKFVSKLRDDSNYKQVKIFLDSNASDDSQTMNDLGLFDSGIQTVNELGSQIFQYFGEYIKQIADMKIPSKYNK